MSVNTNISDLFFNSDVTQAAIYRNQKFVEYNAQELRNLAENFLLILSVITNIELPTPEVLVYDFLDRI